MLLSEYFLKFHLENMAEQTTWGIKTTLNFDKAKNGLTIPLTSKGMISLSDIIAATIGEDTRSCDTAFDQSEPNFGSCDDNGDDFRAKYSAKSDSHTHNATMREREVNLDYVSGLMSDNSNNACDSFDKLQENGQTVIFPDWRLSDDSGSHSSFGCVPNITSQNSNTKDSIFNETSNGSHQSLSKQTDFSNLHFDFAKPVGFDTNYDTETDFITNLCESWEGPKQTTKDEQIVPETREKGLNITTIAEESKQEIDRENNESINLSYDSDLEDSMQFVDPDDTPVSITDDAHNPHPKKRRVSEYGANTSPFPAGIDLNQSFADTSKPDLLTLLHAESREALNQSHSNKHKMHSNKHKVHGISRTRSFSGSTYNNHGLLRPKSEFNEKSFKTPTMTRARSFSEACHREEFSPLDEGRFNTSLSSLLGSPGENSPLSNNPFFSDLRSTLISDCQSMDIPEALFETISCGPKLDVYARERGLQSKFSNLQTKYPDEVRELSSFYRCQSAEVETERFREIHDENIPTSYRNHLNRYYDSQLHKIMSRVEKSLGLLTIAERDIVTINRSFRPRPLLSRKAVSMMEEWFTRNFEHPYPSHTAVEALAKAGEIGPEQVKKWFANKRNRCKNTRPMSEVANLKRKRQFSSRW